MKMYVLLWVTSIAGIGSLGRASSYSDFNRCYSRLPSQRLPMDHKLLSSVNKGEMTAQQACLKLFDDVELNDHGDIVSISPEGQMIIENFHRLHSNWFLNRDLTDLSNSIRNQADRAIYDPMSPASYFNYVLFNKNTPVKYLWTTTDTLVTRRENHDPQTSKLSGLTKKQFIFKNTRFAATGSIKGVLKEKQQKWEYEFSQKRNGETKIEKGSVGIFKNAGACFLGNPIYLVKNILKVDGYRADGGVKMPRKWAKAVVSDVLCRELPLVNQEDVTEYVDPASDIAFRNAATCTTCHATMDQLAAGTRGVYFKNLGSNQTDPQFGGFFTEFHPNPTPTEYDWKAIARSNYWQLENRGVLYFRDFYDELIEEPFHGLSQLGMKLSMLDDPDICLTKRYLEHFTGGKYEMSEKANSAKRNKRLLDLSKQLKETQNLRGLVSSIINE